MMEQSHSPQWTRLPGLSDYASTVARMEAHVEMMLSDKADEAIWLVEHPPLLTSGTAAQPTDLLAPHRFPIHAVGRGGRFTYHGPGQRVIYPMLNLGMRGRDVRRYVEALEAWAIASLADCGIEAGTSDAGTGIWVRTASGLAKIGAIGVRVRRWVTFHGMALNVSTDLDHYSAIVPCGLADYAVTRMADLAPSVRMNDLDQALHNNLAVLLHRLSAQCVSPIKKLEAAHDCR